MNSAKLGQGDRHRRDAQREPAEATVARRSNAEADADDARREHGHRDDDQLVDQLRLQVRPVLLDVVDEVHRLKLHSRSAVSGGV